ncbi:MAG: competence/damage-inducible protein A [Clostridia bacterium]|nr:competence/damage-inducible protein A [Clostridia bacterium]
MTVEILCVGTELLMGQVLNTNAQFLARQLASLGITAHHQTVVGDNPDRLAEAYRLALSRADVVITSGGLGPTVDDITKAQAARVLGKELVQLPEAEEMVREAFRAMNRPMSANNLRQARFVPGTRVIPNHHGTAPGAIVPAGEGRFIVHLPGPPRELEPMFTESIRPWLASMADRVLVSRYIRIFGMGESAVDERLRDLELGGNPTLSPYCSTGEVMLRLTASAESEAAARPRLEPVEREIRRRLGDVIYDIRDDDGGSLAASAIAALKARGATVCTAESLTGGLIAATLVNVPGASDAVRGGFVTYQTETKTILLGVPADVIERCDVVSAEVAYAMAAGARERLGADYALSATGLAGPGGGTPERPVGTVFVGIAGPKGVRTMELHLTGDRERIRTLTVKHAIAQLLREARETEE